MESLSETTWDVIICGTGLQQSLLALALSRSDKKILHIDPNEYYGGPEAAFSLQEADAWASAIASNAPDSSTPSIFGAAVITRPQEAEAAGLSSARAYALSLSPQLVHANSKLLSQLVSSRAYRQLEFLAVGSFYIFKKSSGPDAKPSLSRIPSTREDVFSSTELSARSKRQLMKFLKLVLSYEEEAQVQQWQEYADKPLSDFLTGKMGLDAELQTYITTLTLSADGNITTKDGLATIHRHLTSMGVFGTGFAAVYPKWGGGSEIAQVACRAGAVGGGIYMLGAGIKELKESSEGVEEIELELTSGMTVKTKMLVRGSEKVTANAQKISRLVVVVDSAFPSLFEITVEGAPKPATVVIAIPPGSVKGDGEVESKYPIYAIAHSSDTGECPNGQSVLYFSTVYTPESQTILERCLTTLLTALDTEQTPRCLYQMYYEQSSAASELQVAGQILNLPPPSLALTFDDSTLEPVHQAWKVVMGATAEDADPEYMIFPDREGVSDDDDAYDY